MVHIPFFTFMGFVTATYFRAEKQSFAVTLPVGKQFMLREIMS